MRLLYIHNIAMPGPEANTVNVAKMCDAFAALGCEVTLAALTGAGAEELRTYYGLTQPVRIDALPRSSRRPTFAAAMCLSLVRRIQPDLVYTRIPHAALTSCMAGAPTALELHTDTSSFSPLGRWAALNAAAHSRMRAVVAISDALARRLRERLPGAPIIVAHDGADARALAPNKKRDRFRAGFVGRFYKGKGVELIAEIARLCPWAEFALVGGYADAAARVVGEGLPENVKLLGPAPHARVAEFVDSCDVMLAPYQRVVMVADGRTDAAPWMSPLKIFEYMAAAKPMLASDLPVIREVLTHGETALLLPPDDAGAWARALSYLRARPDVCAQLGEHAHEAFLTRHTWIERARQILAACELKPAEQAAYERVTDASPQPPLPARAPESRAAPGH